MGHVDEEWKAWAISNAKELPEHQRGPFIAIVEAGNQVECANAIYNFFGRQGIAMSDHPSVVKFRKLAEAQRRGDPSVLMPNQPAGGFTFPALIYTG